MTIYHNDALHLSYSYPSTYTDASSLVGTALQAGLSHESNGSKDLNHCLSFPLSAMDTSSGGLAVVLLGRADAACMKKTFTAAQLPEFTQDEVQGLMASGARPDFTQPVAFTTEGHAAELLRGSFALPTGQRLQTLVSCVLMKPDVVCWQFLAGSEEKLIQMTSFPVSLDGAPPSRLIPVAMLAKP